jgi:ATP-dependent Clp protease protease subunit
VNTINTSQNNFRLILSSLVLLAGSPLHAEITSTVTAPTSASTTIPSAPLANPAESNNTSSTAAPAKTPDQPKTDPLEQARKALLEAKAAAEEEKALDPETQALQNEQLQLSIENALIDERLKKQFSEIRSRLQQLAWEKDLLSEQLELEKLKREASKRDETIAHEEKLQTLIRENELLTEQLNIAKTKHEAALLEASQTHEDELQKLVREKEMLSEKLEMEKLQREIALRDSTIKHEDEMLALTRKADIAKEKASELGSRLEAMQTEWNIKTAKLESEMNTLEIEQKRKTYANSKPKYLKNPLLEDGTLVISDRRIALNGPITRGTADYVTSRINYYNNADPAYPIFIVIDTSPGGSVMEGYRILKAMEGSEAPVYVVVKSFAASMAAAITTLARKSYAYPNALILHHQISATIFARMNLTQQKEFYETSKKWWERLAQPIAKKMGITTDEFIKEMYDKSSRGDWSEFGNDATKLKWVDHIVERIQETSLIKDPNAEEEEKKPRLYELKETLDKDGHPFMYLPRLTPKDHYYIYNPDNYYRLR